MITEKNCVEKQLSMYCPKFLVMISVEGIRAAEWRVSATSIYALVYDIIIPHLGVREESGVHDCSVISIPEKLKYRHAYEELNTRKIRKVQKALMVNLSGAVLYTVNIICGSDTSTSVVWFLPVF